MTRRSEKPARTRRHVWIDDEDWEKITQHFSASIGTSAAVRAMLKAVLKGIEERAAQKGRPVSPAGVSEIIDLAQRTE